MSISGISGASAPAFGGTSLTGATASLLSSIPDPATDPAGWLQDYFRLTPAQMMAVSILHGLGMTISQYDALSPEERAKVDAKIEQKLKQEMEQQQEKKTGTLVSLKA